MANNKPISDNVAFPNQSNVRAIAGLAGYITGTPNTNVKIGGVDLVQSVINGTTAASGGLAVYATSGTVKELATYISLNYTAGDTTAPAVLELGTPSHPSTVQISGNYNGPDTFVSPKLTFLTKNTTTGSNTVSIEPSGVATADQSLIIPPAPGVANQALRAGTVGSGGNVILEWYTPTDDNTTYSLATTADTNDGKVTLTPSTGTAETITFTGANGVVISSDASNNVTVTGPTPQTLPEPGGAAGNVQFNSNPVGTFEGDASFFFNKTGTDSSLSIGDVGADRGILNIYGGPSNSGTISITDPNDEGLTLTVPNSMSASYTLTFPEADPTNNAMILQSDSSGDLSWIDTPTSSGPSAFTNKAGADVISWDYATDGPNLRINLGSGNDNVITVDNLNEFPNGSTGFIIMNPQNSTSYKMPDETYGSATGIASKMAGGDSTLGGTNNVLWEWTYDGATFYWQKFQNYVDPVYPPSLDFDSTNLMAFYDPATYPNSVNGANVSSGTAVEDLTNGTLIGDLAIGTNTDDFEHYTADASVQRPAFWSMGDDDNSIQTPGSGFTALTTNHTVQCYIQGPWPASYNTIIDFDTAGDGGYEELLYVNDDNLFEFDFSASGEFGFPALENYPTSGVNLSTEWLFVSMSTSNSTNEVTLYVGCQSSLDAAVAAGGATNWDYSGNGDTVAIDANGLYKETLTNQTIPNDDFDRFFYGQSVSSTFGESARCHLGILGIYSTILTDAQVASNWSDSRGVYYIS